MAEEDATAEGAADPAEAPSVAGDGEDLVARVAAADEALADDVADLVERADDLAATVEELEAALDDREAEVEELTEKLQRTRADFQNYKKRAEKRREQVEERATEELVERLLDVREDLGRALDDDSGDVDALREGVELTAEEFDRVLEDEGVEAIAPEPGSDVDPARHEVLMRVESDRPEGTVDELYRRGYEMGGKVLRTAQVTVSEGDGDDGTGDGDD